MGCVVLACAAALEAALSGLSVSGPPGADSARLFALGVILCGCLRNEFETAAFALISALVFSAVDPGARLGPALIGFTIAGWLAAPASRIFLMDLFAVRLFVIGALVVIESVISTRARIAFAPGYTASQPWLTHGMTALLGALIHPLLDRRLSYRPAPPVPLGRRRYHDPGPDPAPAPGRKTAD